jgi:hypothetical protein
MSTQAHDRRFRERWFVNPSLNLVSHADVPADVTVLETHVPCFRCGSSGGCRHRPWLIGEVA